MCILYIIGEPGQAPHKAGIIIECFLMGRFFEVTPSNHLTIPTFISSR